MHLSEQHFQISKRERKLCLTWLSCCLFLQWLCSSSSSSNSNTNTNTSAIRKLLKTFAVCNCAAWGPVWHCCRTLDRSGYSIQPDFFGWCCGKQKRFEFPKRLKERFSEVGRFWKAVSPKLQSRCSQSEKTFSLWFLPALLECVASPDRKGAHSVPWGDNAGRRKPGSPGPTSPCESWDVLHQLSPAMAPFPNSSPVAGADCPLKDAASRRISKLTVKVSDIAKNKKVSAWPVLYCFRSGSPRGTET